MFKKSLLFLALLAGISPASHAILSASDLVSRARVFLKDSNTSTNRQQFTDGQYLQWASDGQREANSQNWLLQSSVTVTLVAGTTEYAMPTDFMFPNRVWVLVTGQPWQKLPASSFNDLDARYPAWQSVSGGPPMNYFLDMSSQTVYMGFYPAPTSASLGTVSIMYVQNTVDLTSGNTGAIPFNGWFVLQPYASALPYYMAYRAYLTLEETDLANAYLQYWVQFLLIMRQGVNRQPDFNPGAAGFRGSSSPQGMGGLGGP